MNSSGLVGSIKQGIKLRWPLIVLGSKSYVKTILQSLKCLQQNVRAFCCIGVIMLLVSLKSYFIMPCSLSPPSR
jgi:hypothetical protein